ncbi:OmpA family protein [Burkholderia pseudomallei]|uniref:OmpA family protein n=1 Tax=Burkholderia pseudomallei TaxID=28450 RepID=UPI0005390894|nr:OmpA family protein [Burkholderia pseudomallei]KAA8764421.1 OmpA family protein [Burkholderia pseudomallei]KGW59064.1 ompA family protein [Burkholderia pseudomallei MSHR1357]KKC14780.1 ompA family protein [Burkholderia pseudomallei MSHR1328]
MEENEKKDTDSRDNADDKDSKKNVFNLDGMDKLLTLSAKLIPIFGVMILFSYCTSINFYPSGLTVGDTIFFVFAIIAFGTIYGFIIGAAIYCSANIYGLISRVLSKASRSAFFKALCDRSWGKVAEKIFTILCLVVPFLVGSLILWLICELINKSDTTWGILSVLGLLSIGLCIWVIVGVRRDLFKKNPIVATLIVLVLIFMPLIMVRGLGKAAINTAMQMAGVRIERALIDIPLSEYARVKATARRAAMRVPPCRKFASDRCMLRADVLFQGVGQQAQIRLPIGGAKKDEHDMLLEAEIFVTLKQKDVQFSAINPFTYGADINSDTIFDFDSAKLSEVGRSRLNEIAKEVENYRILSLEVTGHTDRLGSDKHNLELSQLRAQSVADYLVSKFNNVSPNVVHARGVGASDPRLDQGNCPGKSASPALQHCLTEDRYVEVDIVAVKRPTKSRG